ncbi:hypothetical protein Tco_0207500, partial [Tanacetum coccineum]
MTQGSLLMRHSTKLTQKNPILWLLKGFSGISKTMLGCNLDRKSTIGGYQILGGKSVCWSVKKQGSVAMSSSEAEYVTAAGCCAQVLWIK